MRGESLTQFQPLGGGRKGRLLLISPDLQDCCCQAGASFPVPLPDLSGSEAPTLKWKTGQSEFCCYSGPCPLP